MCRNLPSRCRNGSFAPLCFVSIRLPNKTDSPIFTLVIINLIVKNVINMELKDSVKSYKAPLVKVIDVNIQNVLCQSDGNESMREVDYGDGNFSEE